MFTFHYKFMIALSLSLLISACNSENSKNIADGEKLFNQRTIGFTQAPGCVLCHSLAQGIQLVGPSLYAIGQRAGQIKPNMDAKQYLYEAIIDPAAYTVHGYRHDQMYPHYANDLEPQEIQSLIEFLLTQ
jgi:cytochrome c551/c552